MRFPYLMLAVLFSLSLTACQKPTPEKPVKPAQLTEPTEQGAAMSVQDPNSYAEPTKVLIKHLALELAMNFDKKTLAGTATLDLDWKDNTAEKLVLDTRDLSIEKIEGGDGSTWEALPFELAARDSIFGSKLSIAMSKRVKKVRISYRTSPEASGLQWLTPEMTLGKQAPFMFSQSQAIHARSWVPLQDTPSVRFTYEAHITTPSNVTALMSADNDPNAARDGDYRFTMPQPIPSYLLAIAAGDLVFRPLSKRSGIWAEPAMADKAAKEFEDTEKMITTAESLYGPYRWGRYDILVLPPSFPFGGMENPRLTFATPTVIVGDKSLVNLIAHELAHSWSGNLVTNSTWKDIWLNEGFTSYVDSRITEAVYGRELTEMENVIGQHGLVDELKSLAVQDQVLALPALTGRDPDEALTGVPYTKGQWFLTFLEERYGRAVFDPFLRQWFDSHAFTSTDNAEFERFLMAELVTKHPGKTTAEERRAWIHEPGIPTFATAAKSARFDKVDQARTRWLAQEIKANHIDHKQWSTQERVHFIEGLPEILRASQLAELDTAFHFTGTANYEIAQRWYPLAVNNNYATARPAIAEFLGSIGRRKLIMPTYKALAKTPEGLEFAQKIFIKAKPGYHPITAASVQDVLAKTTHSP